MLLPVLGVGIIYSPALQPLLEAEPDLVSVIEVEPETLWTATADPAAPYRPDRSALASLRALPQAKLVHGVGFPVGGSRPPDPLHLPRIVEAIGALEAPWASEHLAFNRAGGPDGPFASGFLLPPLQSPRGVDAAAASIRSVAAHLPVPFAVETGVNYLQPRAGEMSDGAFVAAVAEAADCGIVLDLHNLWSNERNGRQAVEETLAELPLERVWEVHLAGGSEFRGYWLDAHSGAVPGPLLQLATRILPELPELRSVIFEITPTFLARLGEDGLRRELAAIHEIWERRGRSPRRARERRAPARLADGTAVPETATDCGTRADGELTPAEWEDGLAALVVGRPAESPACLSLAGDPGVAVLRQLVWNFRSGVLVEALSLTCRLLLLHGGDALARELFDGFFLSAPPELFASVEAEAFADYLERRRPEVPFLPEVLGYERAAIRAVLEGRSQWVPFGFEPLAILAPLSQGRLPEAPLPGRFEVEVTPEVGASHVGTAGVLSSS